MMNTSKTMLFFGTEDFSLEVLKGLVEAGFHFDAVVTKPDMKSGRGQKLISPPVKIFALEHNIPVWQPTKLSEINEDIKKLGRPAGVLASFGKIIPKSTLSLFEPGIINVHPSLLPLFRGASPIESAIVSGETETGVSIMKLVEAMDAGPVYIQEILPLTGSETSPELYSKLARIGTSLLIQNLPKIISQDLLPKAQSAQGVSYTEKLSKNDAWLDMNALDAREAQRRVRAYLDYPKARVSLSGATVIILKAHVEMSKKTPLDIAAQDGAFLSIDELIAPSGKRMSASAYLNGYGG